MATFEDTFTGSSPDLTWTGIRDGGELILNGDGTASIPGSTWPFVRAQGADTDASGSMYVEATVAQDFTSGGPFALLLVGLDNSSGTTGYGIALNQDQGWCTILRYVDSGGGPIGTPDESIEIPDAPFTFRAELDNGTVSVYLNGDLVKSETDSNPLAGSYGGLGVREGGTTVRFGSFEVGGLDDDGGGDPDPDPDPPEGAPFVVSATTTAGNDGQPLAAARPGGLAAGDLLVWTGAYSYSGSAPTVPGGFDIQDNDTSQHPDSEWDNAPNVLTAFRWVSNANTEPTTYTGSSAGDASTSVVLAAVRGVDPNNPLADGFVSTPSQGTTSNITAESRELSEDDTLWMGVFALQVWDEDAGSTVAAPSGTEEVGQASTMWTYHLLAAEARSAGSVPQRVAVGSGAGTAAKAVTFALRAAAGGGPGPVDERVNLAPNPAVDPTGTGWGNAGSNSGSGAAYRVEGLDVFPDRDTGWRTGTEASPLQTLLYAPRISIDTGQGYAASLYAHALVAGEYTFYAEWHDSSNGFVSNAAPPQLIPIGDAQTVRVSFTTGEAPAAAATLRLSAASPSAQSPLVLSQALYEEGSELRPYFDGDSEDAEWTGERGNSPSRLAVDDGGAPDSDEAAVRYGWGAPLPASDEFDAPGFPDPARWSVYGYDYDANGGAGAHGTWPNPHGNGFRNSENAEIITEGGETFLRLRGDTNGDQGAVSSGFDQQYGRWEIRARFDRDASTGDRPMNALGIIWPESEVWPEDGEYDFLETPSGGSAAQAWIHYPHQVFPENAQEQAIHPGGINLTEFHNYAFEWDTDGVRCWIDGEFWYEFAGQGGGAVPNGWGGAPEDFRVADIQDMPSGHLTLQYDNFANGGPGDMPQAGAYDIEWVRIYPPPERQLGPGTYAGQNQSTTVGSPVTLSGIDGAGTTSRTWMVISGPERYGDEIGTEASVEFTPQLPGTYVLEYTASGAGTSSDRVKVHAARTDGSVARVNLALNPQFGDDPGGGPAMWWGGDQVPVSGLAGITTGLRSEGESIATGRFLVADSNWHNEEDRLTVSAIVVADAATTITAGVDFYTALNGGSFIENGAKVSNSTQVQVPAGVPTWVTVRDRARNPAGGNPAPQPMVVPSNAVAGLLTASSVDDTPFLVTGLLVEHGTEAPDGTLPGIVTTGGE